MEKLLTSLVYISYYDVVNLYNKLKYKDKKEILILLENSLMIRRIDILVDKKESLKRKKCIESYQFIINSLEYQLKILGFGNTKRSGNKNKTLEEVIESFNEYFEIPLYNVRSGLKLKKSTLNRPRKKYKKELEEYKIKQAILKKRNEIKNIYESKDNIENIIFEKIDYFLNNPEKNRIILAILEINNVLIELSLIMNVNELKMIYLNQVKEYWINKILKEI